MEITHKEESSILLIAIKGRLDGLTVPSAERSINEILGRGSDRLLFDFRMGFQNLKFGMLLLGYVTQNRSAKYNASFLITSS